jgi:biopolymer transport protein ExbD
MRGGRSVKIRRRHLEAGIPVVAMADIAFNLVLFFIILARTQDDSHLKWQPASSPNVKAFGQSRVSVTVDDQKKVYLNGEEKNIDEMTGRIEFLLKDVPGDQRAVLLKIHRETPASIYNPIIAAVSKAGGEIVHVLTEENQ